MFKAVTDVYIYMYIYQSEYNFMWSKKINVKDIPVLPSVTHFEYHFCFHDMYFTRSYMFQ